MDNVNFSFRGIQDLCRVYYRDIIERKDIKHFLLSRRVRFINPMGRFDYAYFGDYYFNGDVMMLITKDRNYTPYHKPDQMSHTLWSTVPVIFAGVETRLKDDMGQEIFTGDVVTYQGYTSVVRYFDFDNTDIPGMIGDNCDIQFNQSGVVHKVGTAFVDVNPIMFKEFNPFFVRWAAAGFCQGGPSFEKIGERASLAMDAPTFIGGRLQSKKLHHWAYEEIDEMLTDDMTLTYLRDCESYEDLDGEPTYTVFADNLPSYQHEKCYAISMPDKADFIDDLKNAISEFLLYAHSCPEEVFVLADFKGVFHITGNLEIKVAKCFCDWLEFQIRNVVLPLWIFNNIVAWDMIGRD